MPSIPCWLIQLQSLIEQFTFRFYGAAASGFNSLILAPSVPSLISTEPVELLCRTSNISSTDPFCFVKQKTGNGLSFLAVFYLQICAASPSVRKTKIHGDKGYHTALITIKQVDHTQVQAEIRSTIRLERKFTTRFAMFTF